MSCPDCFSGHVHSGKPTGEMTKIHGLETYVARPPNGMRAKGIIVIVPDAFGLPFVNNKLLADHYAEKGQYLAYLPDFMAGNACPEWVIQTMASTARTGTAWDWVSKPYNLVMTIAYFVPFMYRNRAAVTWPRIRSFFEAVRENEGASLGIGAAGFCWGGPHAAQLAADEKTKAGKPLVDASFAAHPSNMGIPDQLIALKKPFSLALGDRDFVVSNAEVIKIKEALTKCKVDNEVVVYPGAGHGFGVRADPDDKNAMEDAAKSEHQAMSWFDKHLPKAS